MQLLVGVAGENVANAIVDFVVSMVAVLRPSVGMVVVKYESIES